MNISPVLLCDRTSSKRKGSWANSSPLAGRSFAVSYRFKVFTFMQALASFPSCYTSAWNMVFPYQHANCLVPPSVVLRHHPHSAYIFCWQHPHVHNVCGWNAFHDPWWLVWNPSTHIWPHLGPVSAWVRAQVVPAGLRTLWRILSGPCRCRCHHLRRFFFGWKMGGTSRNPRLFTSKNTPQHQV